VGRMACSESLVPTTAWKSGRTTETQRKQLASARRIISEAPMHWLDGRKSMGSVAREARYLKARYGIRLVVFDHIQRAARRQETAEIAAVSSALKDLALDLDLPVIALSQLNRDVEKRNPPKPQLADLRGAGDIEQDADIVALLYRPAYYEQNDESQVVELCISKNRNGPTGMVELLFDQECVRFWEPS
jgi:replicative DNA helicase